MKKTDLKETIIHAIMQKKMTIPHVAKKAGINHNTLYNWLKGDSDMKSSNLEKIMEVLDVHISI
ncbi:MAG: helix-turn-helix transcriptional regulator [bacterium]|jgi:predicted transcriptional regulator|nr:helix-turn-helix transcriptional regulator [bacterium]